MDQRESDARIERMTHAWFVGRKRCAMNPEKTPPSFWLPSCSSRALQSSGSR